MGSRISAWIRERVSTQSDFHTFMDLLSSYYSLVQTNLSYFFLDRYQFFSDGSFSNLFWADSYEEEPSKVSKQTNYSPEVSTPSKPYKDLTIDTADCASDELSTPTTKSPSSVNKMFSPANKMHLSAGDDVVKNFFPFLEYSIVKDVEFPGLNALEFFEVYFADNAPYSFKEFQVTKGDIDINYTKWTRRRISEDEPQSFHPRTNQNGLKKFPTSSKKERELSFKTLTKSYFGPAYATAKKTQRVTKFSTRLVIIESKTELFNIPFCDRFFVVERWVVEAHKHDRPSSMTTGSSVPIYTSKLSVDVEVFMLKSCNFERQIREKTLSTVTTLLEEWTTKATHALDLATRKKMERRKIGLNDDGTSIKSYRSGRKTSLNPPNQERALKMHQQKLKVIEERIFNGDMDWCSIEMRHSEDAGPLAAFAEIVGTENPETVPNDCPHEISIPQSNKGQKKKVMRIFRSRKTIAKLP